MGGYAGAESGNGLADVLFGDINPFNFLNIKYYFFFYNTIILSTFFSYL